jgi:hypothetical protein
MVKNSTGKYQAFFTGHMISQMHSPRIEHRKFRVSFVNKEAEIVKGTASLRARERMYTHGLTTHLKQVN